MTVFNLQKGDDVHAIGSALKTALVSLPAMQLNAWEVDMVPSFAPGDFADPVARVDVDLWKRPYRTKEGLQEVASRMADAFRGATNERRKVKVVLHPYDITKAGWISLA